MSATTILFEFLLKSSAIVFVCGTVSLLLRKQSAMWENRLWRICMIGVALTPLWAAISHSAPMETGARLYSVSQHVRLQPGPLVLAPEIRVERGTFPAVSSTDWDRQILFAYIAGLALALAWLVLGLIKVRRILKQAVAAGEGGIYISNKISVPGTVGLWRPVILLPEAAESWDSESLASALLHERTHIRREDWSWQLAGQFVRALFWFSPFVWLMDIALRISAERACDDEVVASGHPAAVYAKQLLAIVASAGPPPESIVAMARKSGLKGRLTRILAPGYPFRATGKAVGFGLAAFVSLASVALGGTVFLFYQAARRQVEFFGPVKLTDGKLAKLVSVRTRSATWAPGGGPITDKDFGFASWPDVVPAGKEAYGVHIAGEVRDRDSIFFQANPSVEIRTITVGQDSTFVEFEAPKVLSNVNLHIGFSSRPFQMIAEDRIGQGETNPTPQLDREQHFPEFAGSFVTYRGLSLRLQLPRTAHSMDLRAAVALADGRVLYDQHSFEPRNPQSWSQPDATSQWFHFPLLKSATGIKSVRLFARPIEWVDFTGVHLRPSKAR